MNLAKLFGVGMDWDKVIEITNKLVDLYSVANEMNTKPDD
jgi:hypothetical protein